MARASDQSDFDTCIFEAPAGGAPARARDCSDEMLADGEQISDAERKEIRDNRGFQADWSIVRNARRER